MFSKESQRLPYSVICYSSAVRGIGVPADYVPAVMKVNWQDVLNHFLTMQTIRAPEGLRLTPGKPDF